MDRTADVVVPTSVGLFHRVTGATPYTYYYARVAASTSIGEGPFSEWVSARTLVAGEPTLVSSLPPLFLDFVMVWVQLPFTNVDMDDIVNTT